MMLRREREDGFDEGKLEGIKEGELKGLREGQISMAKSMKTKSLDINLISKIMSLSIDEIKNI